ncbi:MAG: PA14 domain-containing protein [Caldilineaceae bacterium]
MIVTFFLLLFALPGLPVYGATKTERVERSLDSLLQQTANQVYGLRGKLRAATGQSFGNYFDTLDGKTYGVIGESAQIEQQIIGFASSNPSVLVKIWGTIQPASGTDVSVIIVSGILPDQPSAPTAVLPAPAPTNYPTAYLTGPSATLRSTPASNGTAKGQLVAGQSCPVTARLADNSWWFLKCNASLEGWVIQREINVIGQLTAVAVEGLPNTSPPAPQPTATATATPTPSPTPVWQSSFYNNTSLEGVPAWTSTTLEPNVNWLKSSPNPAVAVDNFSARFTRTFDLSPANYRLQVQADDGVRLYLDGQLLINEFHQLLSGPQSYRVDRVLSGQHSIQLEYVEFQGDAYLYFALYPLVVRSEWTVGYYNNPNLQGSPVSSQIVPRSGYPIDINWGGQSAVPNVIAADNWSSRWEGNFDFDVGNYTFYANADDGIRIYFDNRLILDAWSDGVHQNLSATVNSVAAGGHDLRVEHYERTGGAFLRVWWVKNQSGGPQ